MRISTPEEVIFASSPYEIRNEQRLDYSLPVGFADLDEVDQEVERLYRIGNLEICDSDSIRLRMNSIKDQTISKSEFKSMAGNIIGQLAYKASITETKLERANAISIRAALAFLPHLVKFTPDVDLGFYTQSRDEETSVCTSDGGIKMCDVEGKHVFVFDPMLATGGSMLDLVNDVVDHGAATVTTVSAFTSPQGLVTVSRHPAVSRMITTPLEAGLNSRNYIEGGHKPNSALGDFGDRFFGELRKDKPQVIKAD